MCDDLCKQQLTVVIVPLNTQEYLVF
jgi:hypothetical protein